MTVEDTLTYQISLLIDHVKNLFPLRCDENGGQSGDRLNFYDGPSISMPVQLSICGSRQSVFRPKNDAQRTSMQNLAIASSGAYFTLLFTSDIYVGKFEFGFRLEYQFQDLPTWDSPTTSSVMKASNFTPPKKERVVYFNYHFQTIPTSSTPEILHAALNLYMVIGKPVPSITFLFNAHLKVN